LVTIFNPISQQKPKLRKQKRKTRLVTIFNPSNPNKPTKTQTQKTKEKDALGYNL
jgi:hypothetical protein